MAKKPLPLKIKRRLAGLTLFALTLALLLLGIRHYAFQDGIEAPLSTSPAASSSSLSALGGAYELIDHAGKTKTDKDFLGKYQLVYFGYSYCPDICPAALHTVTVALEDLGKLSAHVIPIFITVDPARDTPSHLKVYKENFHPSLVTLTGDKEQIQNTQKAFKVYAQVATPDGSTTDYLMDHSSLIYLLNREGKCIALFSHTSPPQQISDKIKEVIAQEAVFSDQ